MLRAPAPSHLHSLEVELLVLQWLKLLRLLGVCRCIWSYSCMAGHPRGQRKSQLSWQRSPVRDLALSRILNYKTGSHFLTHLIERILYFLHTWHSDIPVSKSHSVCVGPNKIINAIHVGETYPEVFLWSETHQANKECVIHPGKFLEDCRF